MNHTSNCYTPNCDAFWVGSYPYKDPRKACRKILAGERMLLHWPQLPKRSRKEFTIEQTLLSLSAGKAQGFPRGAASGWKLMLRSAQKRKGEYFKTQVAGPVTLIGKLQTTRQMEWINLKNERTLRQVLSLWLNHAYWQIEEIQSHGFHPIIVLDEPLLPVYLRGSTAKGPEFQRQKTMRLLKSVVKRLKAHGAIVGIHCCNRVSPETLIASGVDLIHFDAYSFPTQVKAARPSLQSFLKMGGIVAWGVVPTSEVLDDASKIRLEKKLIELLMDLGLEGRGLSLRHILEHSMVAPTCGTGLLSVEQSEKILQFTSSLSDRLRGLYLGRKN